MKVCRYCLEAIESHEGEQAAKTIYGIEEDDEILCEWCGEYDDIFKAMENCNPMTDNYGDHDIYIRIYGREIRIPDLAMCYELLDDYLKKAVEEAEL